jgi:hypothetical protein
MGMLNVSDLKPGMVLEEDVFTDKGTKLLPKGLALTERHIEIMQTWNVLEAPVEGVSRENLTTGNVGSVPEDVQAKIKAQVEMRFADFADDEVMNEIARVVTKIRIDRMAAKCCANKQADDGSAAAGPRAD